MSLIRYALCVLFFLNSDLLFASGEVVKCTRKAKISPKMTCLIKYNEEMKVKNPRQVIIRDDNGYWIATGRVVKTSKNGLVGVFSSRSAIKKGYFAKFKSRDLSSVIDYGSAFN